MSNKPQSKEALEAIDFIVIVLKEHERDLDRLIGELGVVTENLGRSSELNNKVERIEQKIGSLQSQISKLVIYLSQSSTGRINPREITT
jgi:hypothetical protein